VEKILKSPFDVAAKILAAFLVLAFLVWFWPYFVPPSPFPTMDRIVAEIKAQNYDALYFRLSDRWRRETSQVEYVRRNKNAEEPFFRFGGFIESAYVDHQGASFARGEVYIPVYYRVKVLAARPTKTRVSLWIFKLVFQSRQWRLDGLKNVE